MARLGRALALRPVVTLKHEVTWSFLVHNASVKQTVDLVDGIEAPVSASGVQIGSIVKSVFFEFNLNGVDNSGSAQVFHWYVMKVPASLATPNPTSYNSDQKKFILHRGMEMLPAIIAGSGGTIQTKRVFVVKIPPRLRRFDDGDKLQFVYQSTSASNINFCGIAIYKEFK